jgi:pSer/pThr/pTyr-binding forkhead associated (FHA) protein
VNDQSTRSGSTGAAAGPGALLVIHEDAPRSVALPERGELVLGRADDVSLSVEATSLSRRHARFVVDEDGALTVEDLASRNGTRVGVAIAPSVPLPLHVGDVVECGSVLVLVGRRGAVPTQESASVLVVSADARWFKRGNDDVVNLGRRGALRLLLAELAERRIRKPGTALSTTEMFAVGWPDERVGVESAQARVYTSVQRLRGLGLDGALITRGDGYLLDPAIDVRRD